MARRNASIGMQDDHRTRYRLRRSYYNMAKAQAVARPPRYPSFFLFLALSFSMYSSTSARTSGAVTIRMKMSVSSSCHQPMIRWSSDGHQGVISR